MILMRRKIFHSIKKHILRVSVSKPALLLYERREIMFWNKKKPKSKPQIKTTVPKTFKAKEPPKWQPTFGETKKKDEKTPEVITKSEPKIDWEDKFLKSFQKLTYMGCVERLYFTSRMFHLERFGQGKL